MIRFIRALIYGAFAAVLATILLDWLDRTRQTPRKAPGQVSKYTSESAIDQMGDKAKKALLDELAAQV